MASPFRRDEDHARKVFGSLRLGRADRVRICYRLSRQRLRAGAGVRPDGQCDGAILQAERDETLYWIDVQLGCQSSGPGQKTLDSQPVGRGGMTTYAC